MKTILIPKYGVWIILIIGLNTACINVLTWTHNLCNLILVIEFNFGANLTVISFLTCWDRIRILNLIIGLQP